MKKTLLSVNKIVPLLFLAVIVASCLKKESAQNTDDYHIIPRPQEVQFSSKHIDVSNGLQIAATNDTLTLLQKLIDDYIITSDPSKALEVIPHINHNLKKETYTLTISENDIQLRGGSYQALTMGCTTLLQLIENQKIPVGTITDHPDFEYRGLMVDLSRAWYDVSTLKQLISLCSWYKINYLQLHLTDDGLFTFPSTAFPKLASARSYTLDDLKTLNDYAYARGVTLVPEIDVPGHSSGFIRAMPKLFGLKDVSSNSYTLNMGKEAVYNALDTLFSEVSDAFPHAPYIHLGGDEVFTTGFNEDPYVQAYLKTHDLSDVEALYRHFLVRTADIIKSKGKTPMLWSGFDKDNAIQIPKDVVVMNWNISEYQPQTMLDDGYKVINASWQPLYVVNNRKWSPEAIYGWSPNEWRGSETASEAPALKTSNSKGLLGASMEIWEQQQYKALSSVQERLPVMAERLWHQESNDYDTFKTRLYSTKAKLTRMLFPFELQTEGLSFPELPEPNFNEDMWFQDSLKIQLTPHSASTVLRYTLDGTLPSHDSSVYSNSILLTTSSRLAVQAYENDKPLGQTLQKDYRLVPIKFDVKGLVNNLPVRSWHKHKFTDSMVVTLHSKLPGTLRYTIDNSEPTSKSPVYKQPFTVTHSGYVRAKLFNEKDQEIGSERWEEYEQLQLETSLTTGKPITTSNVYEAGTPSIINNGEIARWDHWGAHTNGNNWVIIDLEEEQDLHAFKVYTFWDGYRYYEYTIEVSNNNTDWTMVVDRSKNRVISKPEGQLDSVAPIKARYLKLNLIRNSANPGLHLVEFQAF